jgi:ribonuclease HII
MKLVGIDEVGRGCWAGPLVAGAVLLDEPNVVMGLKDSKLLTKARRRQLDLEVQLHALSYGLGWVSSSEVDKLGLTEATSLAMQRALEAITEEYDEIIVDGHINFLKDNPKSKALIKADQLIPAVSAASIIAKCARDEFMSKMALTYPDYGFDKHVGYGTSLHLEMLKTYGICDLHRLSFKPINSLGVV